MDEESDDTIIPDTMTVDMLAPVEKLLSKAIREAGKSLGTREARFLVDSYYLLQDHRIRSGNQVRDLTKHVEPSEFVKWLLNQTSSLEDQIKAALGPYAKSHAAGRWALAQKGIGPVIAAGLLANINIEKTPTASNLWSFAGLNPDAVWKAGEKRPWNASLKVLCWKIGHSFVLQSNRETAFYGHLYKERKAMYVARNLSGVYADTAAETLKAKKFKASPTKVAYEAGLLPDGRIDLRAQRIAVKMFLAHFHHVLYESHYGKPPPNPYVTDHVVGHPHYVPPPGWPLE